MRLTSVLYALFPILLVVGCSVEEPPNGITIEREAMAPWASPDTVSVLVTGELVGGVPVWNDLGPAQEEWLDEQGYVMVRSEMTDTSAAMDSVAAVRYYLHAE